MSKDVKRTVYDLSCIVKDMCDNSYDVVFDIDLVGNNNYKRVKLQDIMISHVNKELQFKLSP